MKRSTAHLILLVLVVAIGLGTSVRLGAQNPWWTPGFGLQPAPLPDLGPVWDIGFSEGGAPCPDGWDMEPTDLSPRGGGSRLCLDHRQRDRDLPIVQVMVCWQGCPDGWTAVGDGSWELLIPGSTSTVAGFIGYRRGMADPLIDIRVADPNPAYAPDDECLVGLMHEQWRMVSGGWVTRAANGVVTPAVACARYEAPEAESVTPVLIYGLQLVADESPDFFGRYEDKACPDSWSRIADDLSGGFGAPIHACVALSPLAPGAHSNPITVVHSANSGNCDTYGLESAPGIMRRSPSTSIQFCTSRDHEADEHGTGLALSQITFLVHDAPVDAAAMCPQLNQSGAPWFPTAAIQPGPTDTGWLPVRDASNGLPRNLNEGASHSSKYIYSCYRKQAEYVESYTQPRGPRAVEVTVPDHITTAATAATGTIVNFNALATVRRTGEPRVAYCAPASGSEFPIGMTLVACTSPATDDAPVTTGAAFEIRVTNVPWIEAEDITLQLTSAGVTSMPVPAAMWPTAFDMRGPVSLVCDRPPTHSFGLGVMTINGVPHYNPGSTLVQCSATSEDGGTAYRNFFVNVLPYHEEVLPLALTAPASLTAEASGPAGQIVDDAVLGVASAAGGEQPIQITRVPAGTQFALGLTQVTWTAVDAAGRTASATQQVHVADRTAPQLTVPDGVSITAARKSANATAEFAVSASDAVDGAPAVTCAPASGSAFAIGTTTVACTAMDQAGNTGAASFVVTVTAAPAPPPVKRPVIRKPGSMRLEATGPAGAIGHFVVTATDAVDGDVPVVCLPASGSLFPLGRTQVSCSATNTGGKSATASFAVVVRDTVPPDVVSVTPNTASLVPTGAMTPITLVVVVRDLVDTAPACTVVRVDSAITDATGNGEPDWQITGPLTVSLEAATKARRNRRYQITVRCEDASGNAAREKAAVVVSKM